MLLMGNSYLIYVSVVQRASYRIRKILTTGNPQFINVLD